MPDSQTPSELNVIETPFCGDLRSKKFFLLNAIPSEASDYMDASGHCWCHHTQMPVGPDGYRAAPEFCGSERKCYRSAFSSET